MRHILLASLAAVVLFSGFTPALAQGRDVLTQDGLRLPRSHQYEQYNRESGSYGVVRIGSVPEYVRQGAWIYDRTAQEWVSHPSVGTPNPYYVVGGRDSRREGPEPDRGVLTQDGLRLPRSHQYEQYNAENGTYGVVRIGNVASYVRQGAWIYDRTADEWVSHPSVGTPNPQYGSGRGYRR
jgi:hypothetical protein